MEFTGQAFEEMQEQNVRLLQQLREKDDANLKLMSEVRKFHFKYVINDNLGGDCTLPPPPLLFLWDHRLSRWNLYFHYCLHNGLCDWYVLLGENKLIWKASSLTVSMEGEFAQLSFFTKLHNFKFLRGGLTQCLLAMQFDGNCLRKWPLWQ